MHKLLCLATFFLLSPNSFATSYNEIIVNSIPIKFKNAVNINEHTTQIPFKIVDRLIIIEGKIHNQTGNFIIDTGSETMILNQVHFKTYPFQKATKKTTGILKNVDKLFEKNIEKLSLKEFTLRDKQSDIIDLSHIEKSKKMKLLGIIGFEILKDYEVFIDLYLNQLTLTKVDSNGNRLNNNVYLEEISDTINFKLIKHTIVINGYIGQEEVKFGLDSGAEFNQINKSISRKARKHFYPQKRIKLIGASKKEIEVLYGNLFRVQLSGKTYFGPMKTMLTNLHNMNKAFGTDLDGILGHDFFAQRRVIINYKKEKLYIIKYPLIR
ncbi:hypothetical protein ACOSP6_11230 [Tenacibaculum sp. MEBiC06402]|uniref:hypothetical protein n=1 Tax=unclassified Tenacibaculum TaxID=2635139 RepID=UPI003B9B3F01